MQREPEHHLGRAAIVERAVERHLEAAVPRMRGEQERAGSLGALEVGDGAGLEREAKERAHHRVGVARCRTRGPQAKALYLRRGG